jgi:hypothetical protein
MTELDPQLEWAVVALPVVIERVNQAVKLAGFPSRLLPALGTVLGVTVCVAFAAFWDLDPVLWGMIGVLAGAGSGPAHDLIDKLPRPERAR